MSNPVLRADTGAGMPELVDHFVRVATPKHRDANALLDYWTVCMTKGNGFVIGRDIPARPIARLLRNVVINEPLADGSDMCVRLAGAMTRRRYDREIKGSLLSSLFPPRGFAPRLAASFEVVNSGRPAIMDSILKRGGIEELHSEILLLPVTARDLKSTWLLVGIFYFG